MRESSSVNEMKGSYQVKVWNNRISYKFVIERNITILRGDSATGNENVRGKNIYEDYQ